MFFWSNISWKGPGMYKIAILNNISRKGLDLFTDKYELTDNADEATAILVRSAYMHNMTFSENLLAIARAGAGVNNIPVDKCSERGIVVFNTPGANANAVKELVISAMIMAARNIPAALEWERDLTNDVAKEIERGKSQFKGREIFGKTLGVVGLGYIGVMVANAADALGMNVVGYDPYISSKAGHVLSRNVSLYDTLERMLPLCDYVTIHVPSNSETNSMFDYEMISLMKSKCVLLNFSREKLIVGEDIKLALAEKKLRCYVTDFPTDGIQGSERMILIPHLGASTEESEETCATMAVKEVMDFIENGNIENSVNFPTIQADTWDKGSRLIVLHKNIPAMLGTQTGLLAGMGLNISNLINKSKGEYACTLIDFDVFVDEEAIRKAFSYEGVFSVRFISKR